MAVVGGEGADLKTLLSWWTGRAVVEAAAVGMDLFTRDPTLFQRAQRVEASQLRTRRWRTRMVKNLKRIEKAWFPVS
jgi:hypothetical protein